MTGVAVLGSTGSIGRQALEVIGRHPDRFEVVGAGQRPRRTTPMAEQLAAWPSARWWCADARPPQPSRPTAGRRAGSTELATLDGVELVVVATTGMAALPAVLAALRSGRRVALANKETLITGGHLVTALLDELGGDPARSAPTRRQRALGHLAVPGRGTRRLGGASRPDRQRGTVPWSRPAKRSTR